MPLKVLTDEEVIALVVPGFFEPAQKAKQHPMTPEQSEMMLKFMMMPDGPASKCFQAGLDEGLQQWRMLQYRADVIGFPVPASTLIFLSFVCESAGDITLHLSYLVWRCQQLGFAELTLSNLAEIFPWGFWDKETRTALWDGQKGPIGTTCDNLLDHPATLALLSKTHTDAETQKTETQKEDQP